MNNLDWNSERGAVSVIAAISMVGMLGMGALAVDVGNVMVAKSSLQDAADAGALRGAAMLYGTSNPNNSSGGPVYTIVNQNSPIQSSNLAVNVGNWNGSFSSGTPQTTGAVQVVVTKQVPLYFMGIFGKKTSQISASAVAVVQNTNSLGAGATKLPFAIPQCVISQFWNSGNNQPSNTTFQMGPTHTCGGGGGGGGGDHNNNQNNSLNDAGRISPAFFQGPARHSPFYLRPSPPVIRTVYLVSTRSGWNPGVRPGFLRVDQNNGDNGGGNNGGGDNQGGNNNGGGDNQGGNNNGGGSNGGSNSCITGQLTNFTQQPEDGHFDGSAGIASGNAQSPDMKVNDQIYLQSQDYGSGSNNQNQNHQGDNQHSLNGSFENQPIIPASYSVHPWGWQPAPARSGYLRVDGGGNGGGGDNGGGGGNGGSNGDPYQSINGCSANGDHSCEYSIVPVVDSAVGNSQSGGLANVTGFVCVHVLSASTGTVNMTLSNQCVSHSQASAASNSNSNTQTSYGVIGPPRLAQ